MKKKTAKKTMWETYYMNENIWHFGGKGELSTILEHAKDSNYKIKLRSPGGRVMYLNKES